MPRRSIVLAATGVVLVAGLALNYAMTHTESGVSSTSTELAVTTRSTNSRPAVDVWKSPTCGCCHDWVTYLEEAGFPVTTHDTDDMNSVKARLGLPGPKLASCHTATSDGYEIEGHVPISDIERLLSERPDIVGISAPGMPMTSPGMGSDEPRDYDVLSFDAEGNQTTFSRY